MNADGAVTICNHLKSVEEDWSGGFGRNAAEDAAYIKRCPPPTMDLHLADYKVNGHTVTFDGTQALAFREAADGGLTAFCGMDSRQITVDGKSTVYADQTMPLVMWAHIPVQRRVPLYDKAQEGHYNLISALHKSLRGSDTDAALYRAKNGGRNQLAVVGEEQPVASTP